MLLKKADIQTTIANDTDEEKIIPGYDEYCKRCA